MEAKCIGTETTMRRIGMRTFAGLATIALSSLPVHADAKSVDELRSFCSSLAGHTIEAEALW
jgi:hypothetical protein